MDLTKTKHLLILPDAFSPRQNNSDLTLKVNGQDHLLQVSDTASHSFAPKSSRSPAAPHRPVCIGPSEITGAALVYTGWWISVLDHTLFKQCKGGCWFSAILFSHLQQGYPKSKIRCRPRTSLVQLLQGREVMVQERYRGTITFQTNKRSHRQGISQETSFLFQSPEAFSGREGRVTPSVEGNMNLKAGCQILPLPIKDIFRIQSHSFPSPLCVYPACRMVRHIFISLYFIPSSWPVTQVGD